MRSAHVPVGLNGKCVLHFRIPRSSRDLVTYELAPPDEYEIRRWVMLFRRAAKVTERELRQAAVNTRHPREAQGLLDELEDSWHEFRVRSSAISHFNSFVTLDLMRRVSGGNIMGASGENLFNIAGNSMVEVIRNNLASRGLVDTTDWWFICPRCCRRVTCEWRWLDREVSARCPTCDVVYNGSADFRNSGVFHRGRIIPRVRADVLLEYAWLPGLAHGSYAGSLGHVLSSRSIAVRSGLNVPIELAWDPVKLLAIEPSHVSPGVGADLLSQGRAPLLCYYLLFPPDQLMQALVNGSRLNPMPWT